MDKNKSFQELFEEAQNANRDSNKIIRENQGESSKGLSESITDGDRSDDKGNSTLVVRGYAFLLNPNEKGQGNLISNGGNKEESLSTAKSRESRAESERGTAESERSQEIKRGYREICSLNRKEIQLSQGDLEEKEKFEKVIEQERGRAEYKLQNFQNKLQNYRKKEKIYFPYVKIQEASKLYKEYHSLLKENAFQDNKLDKQSQNTLKEIIRLVNERAKKI
ncbi:hypothetical protein BA184_08605 [Helicobacter pullorum]|uniref:hypothetical protein n=1 Tax=Helicobacter pullorum TaxID=35818 RepID=UPI0008168EB6|nr:hypothetical protein [Helicobacter pullorum]OCR03151.1 hypothetical protein BA729_08245 [Helicobacter pullorum]OCR06120.1 hypothetical protein BA185_07760 [Helicobacter pullorum]OCR08396.1 hypothetical protein BA184_08605 [Helicobacter pullorum]OCR12260.1 hypothetical protein BA730_05615 [Helicobacter pullorum]